MENDKNKKEKRSSLFLKDTMRLLAFCVCGFEWILTRDRQRQADRERERKFPSKTKTIDVENGRLMCAIRKAQHV